MQDDSFGSVTREVRSFSDAREWGQFHLPRNLVLALVGEVGELAAELQWIPDAEIEAHLAGEGRLSFEEELADVFIYALRLADVTGVDVAAAVRHKLESNAARYPVELSRGRGTKAPVRPLIEATATEQEMP